MRSCKALGVEYRIIPFWQIIEYKLRVTGYALRVTGYGLRGAGYELRVFNCIPRHPPLDRFRAQVYEISQSVVGLF